MPDIPIYCDGELMFPDYLFGGEKMEQKVPIDEQETTINVWPAQISKKAEVYSCIPSTVKHLKKLASTRPDAVQIISDDGRSVTALVDRSCVKISPKRLVSDEQRKAAADRFAAARKKKVML